MIWYLTTDDLMKKYVKLQTVEELEKTNYLIMSSRIRITEERENVLNISNLFLNAGMLKGVGFNTESDSILAKEEFKNFLLKNPNALSVICAMIECSILEGEDTVILCSPNELKCEYVQLFTLVIEELFHYPIHRYPDVEEIDLEDVIERILYYKKTLKEFTIKNGTEDQRKKMFANMSKKELKRRLKKRHLYDEDLSKSEMIEELLKCY